MNNQRCYHHYLTQLNCANCWPYLRRYIWLFMTGLMFLLLVPLVRADLGSTPILIGPEADETYSIAWGDWDNDGDLDLAVGNNDSLNTVGGFNRVYENEKRGLQHGLAIPRSLRDKQRGLGRLG